MAAHKYWMPPDQVFDTEAQWTASPFATALNFIKSCGQNSSNPACIWKEIPTKLAGDDAGGALRNPVSLPDDELAKQATTLLGMNKNVSGVTTCSECHAANQTTLRDWQMKTDTAMASCLKNTTDGGAPTTEKKEDVSIDKDEFKTWGPFEVALGGKIEVKMAGTGDADLYVKRNAEPTTESYDCRPFSREPNEQCLSTQFNANGPAKFYVGAAGFADHSKITITVTYGKPDANTPKPKDIVDCLRLEPGRSDSPYVPEKAGIYAAAAHLGFFQAVFKAAFPDGEGSNNADTWALEYGKFKNRVSMPKGNHPRLTQGELDIVAEWFARGLPRLTTYIAPDTGPTTCMQNISSNVQSHVSAMSTQGWQAINRGANLRMYGCGTSSNPRECLTSAANANSKSYGMGWAATGTLRVLRELSFNTYYWMRSSADGRFVANGSTGGGGAVISDLQSDKDMSAHAAYDPGFFPDNRGWMFQGTPIGSAFCTTGLLVRNPDRIEFNEPECSHVEGVSLYQHLGAALGGGDYFAVNNVFSSDNPSGVVTKDMSAGFGPTATMRFTAMMFDGTRYVGKPTVSQSSPHEGDTVLSPSTKLVISRFGNENAQLGYVLRRLDATPTGSSYTVSTPEIARYCVQGNKASISYDEKYFVTHHYVGPNDWQDLGFSSAQDPTFQQMLAKGTSNIILVNMVTGARTRITNMKPGQYALFPHWRSDGWIYFQVRDKNTSKEYIVASDAALP
ncbi:MAG TPA: PPC domain-containing protein, partial [Kofleriaceae bacterium]|nr:PPC domain-containing protein [Kofleriaceae bacterium]